MCNDKDCSSHKESTKRINENTTINRKNIKKEKISTNENNIESADEKRNITIHKTTDISKNIDKNDNKIDKNKKKSFSPEIDFTQMENARFTCGSSKKDKKKKRIFTFEKFKRKYVPNLKVIGEIFKSDIKEIFRNPAVLIIVIGLTIVPSLYAWFNIKAFWDPYGSTKYLKVAVVNQDEGTNFKDQELKLGDKVVDNLKENDKLDWKFVDYKKAQKGLRTGEYYAIIRIPKDFSKDLVSLTKKDVKRATIDYTVNEKLNAIAPKITDKGATTIQQKVDEALIETVSKVSLGAMGGVSNIIADMNPQIDKMKESLQRIDKQLDNIEKLSKIGDNTISDMSKALDNVKKSLPNIKSSIKNSQKLNADMKTNLNQINSTFNNLVPGIKRDMELLSNMTGQTSELLDTISNKGAILSDDTKDLLYRVDSKTSNSIEMLEGLINVLNNLNNKNLSGINTAVSSMQSSIKSLEQLNKITTDSINLLNSGQNLSSEVLTGMSTLATNANRGLIDILVDFDKNIANPINNIHKESLKVSSDLQKVLTDADNIYPNINMLINDATNINNTLKTSTYITQNSVSILKTQVNETIKTLDEIQNNKDFNEFRDIVKSNVYDRIEFLKKPVILNEKKIYKIKNYGSAMTPFYSVLASWVGVLVLLTVLTTNVKGRIRAVDEYFGRMILFTVLSIIQAIIISLGNFLILGVTATNPVIFTMIMIFSSIVFTSIIYSLVSVLGTIGKGVCIFLLVIQIGGSGGTFPIQMTPHFFKAINTIIPFTYVIDACRETVGGIYMPNLIKDLIAMLLFMIISIVLSVLFKEKLNRSMSHMRKMFNHSFLIGH